MKRARVATVIAVLFIVALLALAVPHFARFASPSGCIYLLGVGGCF
jgi:hypothetical protein